MTKAEIIENHIKRILQLSEKARREGLLSLECEIDKTSVGFRDIFDLGLMLVVDGTDSDLINQILSEFESHETDGFQIILNKIKKAGVLSLQSGENPRLLALRLDAMIPLGHRTTEGDNRFREYFVDNISQDTPYQSVELDPSIDDIPDLDVRVQKAMRNFSNTDLSKIILYKPKSAPLLFRNMSRKCEDMIKQQINDIDLPDSEDSGAMLYSRFHDLVVKGDE